MQQRVNLVGNDIKRHASNVVAYVKSLFVQISWTR